MLTLVYGLLKDALVTSRWSSGPKIIRNLEKNSEAYTVKRRQRHFTPKHQR